MRLLTEALEAYISPERKSELYRILQGIMDLNDRNLKQYGSGEAVRRLRGAYLSALNATFKWVDRDNIQTLITNFKPRPGNFGPNSLSQHVMQILLDWMGDPAKISSWIQKFQDSGLSQADAIDKIQKTRGDTVVAVFQKALENLDLASKEKPQIGMQPKYYYSVKRAFNRLVATPGTSFNELSQDLEKYLGRSGAQVARNAIMVILSELDAADNPEEADQKVKLAVQKISDYLQAIFAGKTAKAGEIVASIDPSHEYTFYQELLSILTRRSSEPLAAECFKTFIEASDAEEELKDFWADMSIRMIGSVEKEGEQQNLFYHYFEGYYMVGKPKEESLKTFFNKDQLNITNEVQTLEDLIRSGYELKMLGVVFGPKF